VARPRKLSDDDILAAARQVFLAHGPGASTTVIADAVGLSQAALFKRFGTKDALMLRALMPPADISWVKTLEAGPQPGDLRDQLEAIAVDALSFFEQAIPCMMTLKAAGHDLAEHLRAIHRPPPVRGRMAASAWFAAAIDAGRLRGVDPDVLAFAFIGSLQARAAMAHIFDREPLGDDARRAHARAVADIFWDGIAPLEAP